MNKPPIAVLACGWLGLELAKSLESRGFRVSGSTTTSSRLNELRSYGISPYLISLGNQEPLLPDGFLNAGWLVLSISPAVLSASLTSLTSLLKKQHGLRVLMMSSTAVYPEINGLVHEDDAVHRTSSHSGTDLLHLENSIRASVPTTILRLGGLYGPGRHPGNFLAGKTGLSNGSAPVNLVHREDVLNVSVRIIETNTTGEVFNVVAGEHPARKEFYQKAARQSDLPIPQFNDESEVSFKKVSNKKVITALGYNFVHNDPMGDLQEP